MAVAKLAENPIKTTGSFIKEAPVARQAATVGIGSICWANIENENALRVLHSGGIMREVKQKQTVEEHSVSAAFADLQVLMRQAQDMVPQAHSLYSSL